MSSTTATLCVTLLALSLIMGCQTPKQSPESTRPEESGPDPWALFAQGKTEAAARAFERWRQDNRRAEGTVGMMSIAVAHHNQAKLATLLNELDVAQLHSKELIVEAAWAGLALRPTPARAIALGERACALAKDTSSPIAAKAAGACAQTKVAAHARGDLERCVKGCDTTHEHALMLAASLPIVMASVHGSEPTPFIVDTGASRNLVTTAFAAQHGIKPIEGTQQKVQSPGGLLDASMALVDVEFGGVRVERVTVIVLDLPIEFVGGLISPQSMLHQVATEFDLRGMRLVTSPARVDDPTLASLPLRLTNHIPFIQVAAHGRREVPVVVDTGANSTSLSTTWEALKGQDVGRGAQTSAAVAGGKKSLGWEMTSDIQAKAGDLSWTMERPTIEDHSGKEPKRYSITPHGRVGVDMMMGRRFLLDMPGRQVSFSKTSKLAPWPVGASTTYRITSSSWTAPILLKEEVVQRRDDCAVLEVSYKHPGGQERFRYEMKDTWVNRGKWLISRPVEAMWDVDTQGKLKAIAPKDQAARWLPGFVGFNVPSQGVTPQIAFIPNQGDSTCTQIVIPAATENVPNATLELVNCAAQAWRAQTLTIKGPDGSILYRFEHLPNL